MAAPPSERDLDRRMDQMRLQDGVKGPVGGNVQMRHGLSQPYKNGYAGYNPPPPGTVYQATSRTMHSDYPPPQPQSRDYENLPPGPRVQRQPGPPPGGAPYPYQQPVGSPMQQQGVPHNQPCSPPSVRQEMQKIPDSPTHLYPSRSSLESSPYRYDPSHSQYHGSGYRDPQRDSPVMGYQAPTQREGPPMGYHDPQRDGPPMGYQDPQRDGPPVGYQDLQRDGPPVGYQDPQRDGPPIGYQDPQRDGPPMGYQDLQRDGPPVGYQDPQRGGPPVGYRDPQRDGPPGGYHGAPPSYDDRYPPQHEQHDRHQDHGYQQSQSPVYQKPQSPTYQQQPQSPVPHHAYGSSSPTAQPIYATPEPRPYGGSRSQNQPGSPAGGPRGTSQVMMSQSMSQSPGYSASPASISLTPASATVTRTVPAAHSSVKFRTNDPVVPVPPKASGISAAPSDKSLKEAEVDALTNLLLQNMEATKDPDYYGLCNKCHKTIMGEDAGCTALDQVYHVQCFLCSQCEKSLKGCPFFAMEGNPFCEDCYLNTLEKCSVCSKPITDRILRATGKPYHPQCFTCVVCGKSLDGIPFTVDATNQIHCIEDFHRKFAPRCCICRHPIMPEPGKEETVRVVAMDRSFHVNCYKCEDCGLVLSSEAEGRGCYPLDEHLLCKSCNAKRIQAMTGKMTTEL